MMDEAIISNNIEISKVAPIFNSIGKSMADNFGFRHYHYLAPTMVPPANPDQALHSHFKGIGRYGKYFILSHTAVEPSTVEKLIITTSPKKGSNEQQISKIRETTGFGHPCSLQVCGSFMALGLQATAKGSDKSEIQI
jgi:hypothetical protein